jgi:hypothetical protein
MADIAAGDVTYTMKNLRKLSDSRNLNRFQLAFGDGALTYPAGGIPISIGKLGCPVVVESLVVVDSGSSGYKFQYDQANKKLILMQAPAQTHTHDIKAIGGLTSSEPLLLDASQVFGKNAATNRTIVGANSATTGGVVSATLAAAAFAEPSAVAIAAQTIQVEVIGY